MRLYGRYLVEGLENQLSILISIPTKRRAQPLGQDFHSKHNQKLEIAFINHPNHQRRTHHNTRGATTFSDGDVLS
jgi:hypothetical protein